MRHGNSKTDARRERRRTSPRQQEARVRGLAALNRVRRGQSKSLSQAARVEGTTVRSIQKRLPAALIQGFRQAHKGKGWRCLFSEG